MVEDLPYGRRRLLAMARAVATESSVLLLDEPAAGLDLGAREALLRLLTRLATAAGPAPTVLVTHHVEEIPVGTTHALLLARGRVVAAGPIEQVLTSELLGRAFGLPLVVTHDAGRWTARS
jgi:iron complex transport system ATP-binding protein